MALKDVAPIVAKWEIARKRLQDLRDARNEVRAKEADLTAKIDALQTEITTLETQYEQAKA